MSHLIDFNNIDFYIIPCETCKRNNYIKREEMTITLDLFEKCYNIVYACPVCSANRGSEQYRSFDLKL